MLLVLLAVLIGRFLLLLVLFALLLLPLAVLLLIAILIGRFLLLLLVFLAFLLFFLRLRWRRCVL